MRVIGLDMDGVIADHSRTFVELAAEHGLRLTPAQTTTTELDKHVPAELLTTFKERLYTDPVFARKASLMPGAREALERLAQSDRLVILSRRATVTGNLMLEHLGLRDMFDESNAFFVDQSDEKIELAKRLGVTHYVDDQVKALKVRMGAVQHKYLFDQFDQLADDPAYTRVTSWEQLALELAN